MRRILCLLLIVSLLLPLFSCSPAQSGKGLSLPDYVERLNVLCDSLGYADYTSVTDVFEMRAASMIKTPIPGGYGWMSPESLKLDPTHKNL